MKTGVKAEAGQPTGSLSCCGRPMKRVDSGIYECSRCDCYVMSDSGVIEKVRRCSGH
jgi:hypothetical protein